MNTDTSDLSDLIERSSLGTEGARLLRKRPPKESVESVVTAADKDNPDALVRAAVDGELHAVEQVLRWIRPLVVRYCRTRLGGQGNTLDVADEVAQEVCLAVLTSLPSYRDQGRPFLAFVYGIAGHKVAEAHRAAAHNHADLVPRIPDVPDLADGPEAQVLQGEFAERLAKLIETLPARQREIILLRVVKGLSVEETAEVMGSTPGSVRVGQHRALNRLRTILTSERSLSKAVGPEMLQMLATICAS